MINGVGAEASTKTTPKTARAQRVTAGAFTHFVFPHGNSFAARALLFLLRECPTLVSVHFHEYPTKYSQLLTIAQGMWHILSQVLEY